MSPKKKAKENADPKKHVVASLHVSTLLVSSSATERNRKVDIIIQKGEVKFVNGCAVAVNHRQTESKKITKVCSKRTGSVHSEKRGMHPKLARVPNSCCIWDLGKIKLVGSFL